MQREGKYCGWCQILNPPTSHWREGDKRFHSKECREKYLANKEKLATNGVIHENNPLYDLPLFSKFNRPRQG